MSHYTVAVFHRKDQDIGDLLAPYDENISVAPYVRFTREEAIRYCRENWRQEFLDGKTDEDLWKSVAEDYDNRTDAAGNIYSTYNPNSKWDWYQEGGRWGGLLRLKPEVVARNDGFKTADEARVGDIDFSPEKEKYEDALRFWDVIVDGKEQEDGEDIWTIYNPDYYLHRYGDRETYASLQSQFGTFAVLTPDGVWHEQGQMGWFGCSGETDEEARDWMEHYQERFLDTADPDWILTIVDCHI